MINFDSFQRINPFIDGHNPSAAIATERLINIALPIMQMYAPTRMAATAIASTRTIAPLCLKSYAFFCEGENKRAAYQLIKVVFIISSVAGTVLYPLPTLVVTNLKQLFSDVQEGNLLGCLNTLAYMGAFAAGGSHFLLVSLLLRAVNEIYQASQEFEDGRDLEGFANILYATLHLHAAVQPFNDLCRSSWFLDDIDQGKLNEVLNEAARLFSETPERWVNFDHLLKASNYSNRLTNLTFQNKEVSHVTFDGITFNSCQFKANFDHTFFTNTGFHFCKFYQTEWHSSHFSSVEMNSSHFFETLFKSCSLNNSQMYSLFQKAIFEDCKIERLRFKTFKDDYETTLKDTKFINTKISDTEFNGSLIQNTEFIGCSILRSVFNDALLLTTLFKSCVLPETSFFDVNAVASKIDRSDLKNCLLFDAGKSFKITNSTKNTMTKPVIAIPWDFYDAGSPIANDMKNAIRECGGIVFRVKFDLENINEQMLDAEVVQIAKSIGAVKSIPQEILKQAQPCGEIAEVKHLVGRVVKHVDGVFLPGGDDIQPRLYGKKDWLNDCGFLRSIVEFAFLQEAKDRQLAVLGVCRGNQMINVFLGGTMKNVWQWKHWSAHDLQMTPEILKTPSGKITQEILGGTRILGDSMHHQAIDQLGENVVPVLLEEKDVEMIIAENGRFVGTQFHPESYVNEEDLEDSCEAISKNFNISYDTALEILRRNRNIYANFIERASQNLNNRHCSVE